MDIIERLREFESVKDYWGDWEIAKEAADEIERLRKDYALAWENHLLHEQIFVLTEAKIVLFSIGGRRDRYFFASSTAPITYSPFCWMYAAAIGAAISIAAILLP